MHARTLTHAHGHTYTQNKRKRGVGRIVAKAKKRRPVAMVLGENRHTYEAKEQIAHVQTGNTDKPSHPMGSS